jgi:Tol biopolymer transport system component
MTLPLRSRAAVAAVGGVLAAAGLQLAAVSPSSAAVSDAGKLVFVRSNKIFTSTTSGGSVTQLTSSTKSYRPRWSPDGKRIAFVHESTTGARDLWVMSSTGTDKHQVTHVGDATQPAWSPDGAWLAFGSASHVAEGTTDGKALMKIRSTSPYGSPVVLAMTGFASEDSSTGEIDPPVGTSVDWSPDGKTLTYDSFFSTFEAEFDDTWNIVVYDVATHAVRTVAGGCGNSSTGCEGVVHDPTYSAKGGYLVFSSTVQKFDHPLSYASAGYLDYARVSAAPPVRFAPVGGDKDAEFSPSGLKVVFTHGPDVYTANRDGSSRHRVTTGYNADWQPVA